MHLQTQLTTIDTDTGASFASAVSAYTSGVVSRETAESHGTRKAYPPTESDSQGNLFVTYPLFDAYWSFYWNDSVTGSQCNNQVALSGDSEPYSDETYVQ